MIKKPIKVERKTPKKPEGFDGYYENAILAAIQIEVGTTARGRDLIDKIRELRLEAQKRN